MLPAGNKMKISELKSGQGKVDIEVSVKSKADVRTFNKYGKDLKVCNAVVTDGSADITLSLWNDDCDKVNAGDTVKIINGYVSEFNGTKQLTSGKFGKLEVVGKGGKAVKTEHLAHSPKDKKAKTDEEIEEEIEEQEF